jgi:hypothetical protein
MINSITFDTPIGTDYKRNNRSTRQKSLRCFPTCGVKGHVTGGFCGRPLKVVVELARETTSIDVKIEDYRFIAEIRPVSQPGVSKVKSIKEDDLQRQIRSKYEKHEANGEIFQADSANILSMSGKVAEVELTFNSQHCSWDYSWKSNRWSGPQEQHVVDIIVLRSTSGNDTKVVSFASSSPFVVSSSHKKPVKTNHIKEDDDEEGICLPASALTTKGRRGRAARAEDRQAVTPGLLSAPLPGSTLVAKVISQEAPNLRGGYNPPSKQLKVSADGMHLSFSSCRTHDPRDEVERYFASGAIEQESVNEGALALIQLCVSTTQPAAPAGAGASAAPAAADSSAAVQAKKEKRALPTSSSSSSLAAEAPAAPAKRVKAEEKDADQDVPQGYAYPPPYGYPYQGYPPQAFPQGYPPYGGYPYPFPYGMPPPGPEPQRSAKDAKNAAAAYPPFHPHMYPPHMYSYPPPPHMPGNGGGGASNMAYPAMSMYPFPSMPYPMHQPAPSSKGGKSGAGKQNGGYPGQHDMLGYPHPMHMGMGMGMGMPYPMMPPFGGYPGAYPMDPGAYPMGKEAESSEGGDSEGDGEGSAKCTTPPLDFLPAVGSAEKVKFTTSRMRDMAVPVAVPVTAPLFPASQKSISFPKRPTHSVSTAGDPMETILEPHQRGDTHSVHDLIQQRLRDREAERAAAAAAAAATTSEQDSSGATSDGNERNEVSGSSTP